MKRWQYTTLWGVGTIGVIVLTAALFPSQRLGAFVAMIVEFACISGFSHYDQKRRDQALDQLWQLATAQHLEAQDLAALTPAYGALDWAATARPHRTFYPAAKTVAALTARLAASGQ